MHGMYAQDWDSVANLGGPQVNSAVIVQGGDPNIGTFPGIGHIAWVEKVGTNPDTGNPGIYISQYNAWPYPYDYSEAWWDIDSYMSFYKNW